jgi:hypothetical protein
MATISMLILALLAVTSLALSIVSDAALHTISNSGDCTRSCVLHAIKQSTAVFRDGNSWSFDDGPISRHSWSQDTTAAFMTCIENDLRCLFSGESVGQEGQSVTLRESGGALSRPKKGQSQVDQDQNRHPYMKRSIGRLSSNGTNRNVVS